MSAASSTWTILDTGKNSAEENMRIDAELLESLDEKSSPILHLYDWSQDSATYGYFVDPYNFLNRIEVEKHKLDLARRPTGGGILFHLWDLAFSVLVPASHRAFSPNTLDNYAFVNKPVLQAAEEFLQTQLKAELIPDDVAAPDASSSRFCMARPTKYDVMLEGKKIAGAAQRKTKKGFLHQGSISLLLPPREYLEKILLPDTKVLESMYSYTFPLLGPHGKMEDLSLAREQIKGLLIKYLTKES